MSKYLCWVGLFNYYSKVHLNQIGKKYKFDIATIEEYLSFIQTNGIFVKIHVCFRSRKTKTVNFIIVNKLKTTVNEKINQS